MRPLAGTLLVATALLSGCAGPPITEQRAETAKDSRWEAGGAYYKDDGPPEQDEVDWRTVSDPVVVFEAINARRNRPYEVFGVRYVPRTELGPYREQGICSWYGRRYHGRQTSSGEVYNMYQMTAAHKTLPIPSYAKVTRVDDGRSVIVRVNDRGPFLQDRTIDLSYVAAQKIGVVESGTAEVIVEAILPPNYSAKQKKVEPMLEPSAAVQPPEQEANRPQDPVAAPDEVAKLEESGAAAPALESNQQQSVLAQKDPDDGAETTMQQQGATPNIEPDQGGAATSEAAPEVAPEVAPEAAPEVAPQTKRLSTALAGGSYLQLGAFTQPVNARRLSENIQLPEGMTLLPLMWKAGNLVRVLLGPYPNQGAAKQDLARLRSAGLEALLRELP